MRSLLALLLLLGCAAPAAAITFIQSASGSSAGGVGVQTLAVEFPAAVTEGSTIVVAVAGSLTPSILFDLPWCSVTDSLGTTYWPGLSDSIGVPNVAVYAKAVTTSGTNTVTLTCTTGPTSVDLRMAVHEYSGVATSINLDQYVTNTDLTGSTATDGVTSTAKVTTRDGDLVFGATYIDTVTTVTAGTGFTLRETVNVSPTALVTEDLIQGSQGSVAVTFTSSDLKAYQTVLAAYFDPVLYLRGGVMRLKGGKIQLR